MSDPEFYVGQKVICVHADFPSAVFERYDHIPLENHVYTVSEFFWCREYVTNRVGPSIRLTELPPLAPGKSAFSSWRFRALVDEKALRSRETTSMLAVQASNLAYCTASNLAARRKDAVDGSRPSRSQPGPDAYFCAWPALASRPLSTSQSARRWVHGRIESSLDRAPMPKPWPPLA